MQIAVSKDRFVSCSFYMNVVLKKKSNKNVKSSPKTGLQHVHLLNDDASAHKSSTVAQCFKSKMVNLLSLLPYSPDLAPSEFSSFRN